VSLWILEWWQFIYFPANRKLLVSPNSERMVWEIFVSQYQFFLVLVVLFKSLCYSFLSSRVKYHFLQISTSMSLVEHLSRSENYICEYFLTNVWENTVSNFQIEVYYMPRKKLTFIVINRILIFLLCIWLTKLTSVYVLSLCVEIILTNNVNIIILIWSNECNCSCTETIVESFIVFKMWYDFPPKFVKKE
jgi:hypothetical protein